MRPLLGEVLQVVNPLGICRSWIRPPGLTLRTASLEGSPAWAESPVKGLSALMTRISVGLCALPVLPSEGELTYREVRRGGRAASCTQRGSHRKSQP